MLEILFPSLNEGKIANFSWGLQFPSDPPTVFGTNETCFQHLDLLGLFSIFNIFPIIIMKET